MLRKPAFWIAFALFELAFGTVVFLATRNHYMPMPVRPAAERPAAMPAVPAWPGDATGSSAPPLGGFMAPASPDDPAALAQQADQYFADRQYDRAAELYARLLTLAPDNAEVYNNLGLTLHYTGRSTEALAKLSEGIAVDPTNQRIWLTTGFVNAQLGNIEDARTALSNALFMNPDNDVGRSAATMLEGLPQ